MDTLEELEIKARNIKKDFVVNTISGIPQQLRKLVWDTHIGSAVGESKCFCCRSTLIQQLSFYCGHIISRNNYGPNSIENLRPICSGCSKSMGAQNMCEFIKRCNFWNNIQKETETYTITTTSTTVVVKESTKQKKADEFLAIPLDLTSQLLPYLNSPEPIQEINVPVPIQEINIPAPVREINIPVPVREEQISDYENCWVSIKNNKTGKYLKAASPVSAGLLKSIRHVNPKIMLQNGAGDYEKFQLQLPAIKTFHGMYIRAINNSLDQQNQVGAFEKFTITKDNGKFIIKTHNNLFVSCVGDNVVLIPAINDSCYFEFARVELNAKNTTRDAAAEVVKGLNGLFK